jgi:hypothetical protein
MACASRFLYFPIFCRVRTGVREEANAAMRLQLNRKPLIPNFDAAKNVQRVACQFAHRPESLVHPRFSRRLHFLLRQDPKPSRAAHRDRLQLE